MMQIIRKTIKVTQLHLDGRLDWQAKTVPTEITDYRYTYLYKPLRLPKGWALTFDIGRYQQMMFVLSTAGDLQ
jgi:hypothetical protein